MPSVMTPDRWRSIVLCAVLAIAGCSTQPALRPVGHPPSPISMVQAKQLLGQGRAAEAVSAFRKLLRQGGDDLQGLNGLAIAYSELGRSDLAAEMFSRALAIAPNDPATLNNIGFSALRRADASLARHYLEKADRQKGDRDHDEIEGNLAGLALLERFERMPSTRPAMTRAALLSWDKRSASVNHLKLPKNGRQVTAAFAALDVTPSEPPKAIMVDFTTVFDPFSDHQTTERAER